MGVRVKDTTKTWSDIADDLGGGQLRILQATNTQPRKCNILNKMEVESTLAAAGGSRGNPSAELLQLEAQLERG
jgi:hypothetical protein